MTFQTVDRATNLLSLNDAIKSNDIPSTVAAASALGATAKNKSAAFAFSFQALGATLTALTNKIKNNEGVKLSDVMATQAAVGTAIGLGAESLGDHITQRDPKMGKIVNTAASAVSKTATVYAASAYAMNKSKADFAVWDPASRRYG